jgi:hypothetical protein
MPHFVETAFTTQTLKPAKSFHWLVVVDYSPLRVTVQLVGG